MEPAPAIDSRRTDGPDAGASSGNGVHVRARSDTTRAGALIFASSEREDLYRARKRPARAIHDASSPFDVEEPFVPPQALQQDGAALEASRNVAAASALLRREVDQNDVAVRADVLDPDAAGT